MYVRLSLLMLLQWAVPAAILPLYSLRLKEELGFSPMMTGACAATQAAAAVLSSLIAGQVADRWLSAEKAMAACALIAASALWMLASAREPANVFLLTLAFWAASGPTTLLGTTIAFANLPDPARQFGPVRLWGTVGWLAVSLAFAYWLHCPEWLAPLRLWTGKPTLDDSPRFGSLLAFALAAYAWTMPHTPPQRARPGEWLAPLRALRLLRDPSFAAYVTCVIGACVTFPFVTQNASLLLRELGVPKPDVQAVLSLAQFTEILLLAALPLMLRHLGLWLTMAAGLTAWLLAFGALALGEPLWLVVASLGLHGMYITGFIIAGQVYANGLAHGEVRASVQGLLSFVNGVGLLAGNLLAGGLLQRMGGDLPGTFAVAAGIVAACCVAFAAGFRAPKPGARA